MNRDQLLEQGKEVRRGLDDFANRMLDMEEGDIISEFQRHVVQLIGYRFNLEKEYNNLLKIEYEQTANKLLTNCSKSNLKALRVLRHNSCSVRKT